MTKRRMVVGWLLAALLVAVNVSAVGAAVPDAVGNIPVAVGAGAGIRPDGTIPYGGTRGLDRSTIQNPVNVGTATNVSAIPSNNGNETAALYRPGGTYAVFFEETKAVTVSMPRYNPGPGVTVTGSGSNPFILPAGTALYNIAASGTTPAFTVVFFPGTNTAPGAQPGQQLRTGSAFTLPSGQVIAAGTLLTLSSVRVDGGSPLAQGVYVVGASTTIPANFGTGNTGTITFTGPVVINVTYGGPTQQYDSVTGVAIYKTELVKPPTFNPPNGTNTGELTGADVISPYTTTGKISVYLPDFANFGTNGPSGQGFGTLPLKSRP